MAKTSPSGTSSSFTFSRSTSTKICGTPGRNVVFTAARRDWLRAASMISRHDLVQRRPADVAAVLDLHLEAAAHAEAANRRRREREDDRFLDRRRTSPQSVASIASSVSPLSRRSSQASNVTNSVPAFGAVLLSSSDRPPIVNQSSTPGVSFEDLVDLSHHLAGALPARRRRAAAR